MKKLDNIRSSQSIRQNKKEVKKIKKQRSKNRRPMAFRAFVMTLKVLVIFAFLAIAAVATWVYSQVDFDFGDDLATFELNLSSTIYVADENGNYYEYDQFKSTDKRIWVDIENVPQNMKDAFVAIEDQRFYSHSGVDIKRTMGAVMNVFLKGDSSYGGSTITQQLVKNITQDNERTGARKIREISRAMVLETKFSKDEILELYMNSIYLSQGVHGIQAASQAYFGKDVSELSLAQCASIAGITQYPSTFDPIKNPDKNRQKQLVVLSKMLELNFITPEEYEDAIKEKMDFTKGTVFIKPDDSEYNGVQSYFTDHIFEEAKKDLMREFDYTESYAENLLYNGGFKIYATLDPKIQTMAEDYYKDPSNFPKFSGDKLPQSSIIIADPFSGELKAIVGGRGEKTEDRVLNRATQSKRQPGSVIKPIAVYAPAIEENEINLASYIDNSPININGWKPKNANGRFSGPVPIQTAVSWSYNMPAIRTLQALTIDKSYDYMHNKMHITSIVDKVTKGGKEYSDKNYSSLALGGLTNGVTPLEISAAYCTIANGGTYIEPISYTKICDKEGNVIFDNRPHKNRVFSSETAFLTQELLKGVVKNGTAAGNSIPGIATCGKTGTTDDNKDKWFVGFTPYYCATVWFGYDEPKVINASTNPSAVIWKNIMHELHKNMDDKEFKKPDGIIKAKVCGYTSKYASGSCGSTQYADKNKLTGYCQRSHPSTPINSGKSYTSPSSNKSNSTSKTDKKNNSSSNTNSNNNSNNNSNSGNSENNSNPNNSSNSGSNSSPGGNAEQGDSTNTGGSSNSGNTPVTNTE